MRNKPKRCLKYKGPGDCKNCTPKPAPAKRPWVSSLKHPYIWLESLDSIGRADCGCVLVANHENSGDPAFFQCPLHAAAPELKERLWNQHMQVVKMRDADSGGWYEHAKQKNCTDCKLIAAAERKAYP